METVYLSDSDYAAWDEFVNISPQGSVFSSAKYLESLGAKFSILAAQDNGQIRGGIVLTEGRMKYLINPVFGKYLGILFFPFEGHAYNVENKCREVQEKLLEKLTSLHSFEYTFHPSYKNWLPFYWAGFEQTLLYTYRMDLKSIPSDEALMEKLNARLRNKISKASRESEVRYGLSEEERQTATGIVLNTLNKQGAGLPMDDTGFLKWTERLHSAGILHWSGAFDENGKMAAALGTFRDARASYLVLNGMSETDDVKHANELLIFRTIRKAAEDGLVTFDFEGSMISGVDSFYRQFGAGHVPYFKIWKNSPKRIARNVKRRFFNI